VADDDSGRAIEEPMRGLAAPGPSKVASDKAMRARDVSRADVAPRDGSRAAGGPQQGARPRTGEPGRDQG
jgi:hypothetical protein